MNKLTTKYLLAAAMLCAQLAHASNGASLVTGGNGLYIGSVSNNLITISGGTFTAGNAASTNDWNNFYANGGQGVLISGTNNNFTLIGGTFIGGNSGQIIINPDDSAVGNTVLTIDTEDAIYITNGTYTGYNGGYAFGSENITARGGHGLAILNTTNLVVTGGSFKGGNGGTAEQTYTEQLTFSVDAFGGHGIYAHNVTPTILTNITATGGNGGSARSIDNRPPQQSAIPFAPPHQNINANGGSGGTFLTTSNAQPTVAALLVSDSTFQGGHGGTIPGESQSFPFLHTPPSATGGTGLKMMDMSKLPATNNLILHNIEAVGGNGGIMLDNGFNTLGGAIPNNNVSGGNGANVSGFSNVTIDGGTYRGGDGGTVPSGRFFLPNGTTYTRPIGNNSAGTGMYLSAKHAIILGGTFEGGHRNSSSTQTGTGLYFQGQSLTILDGHFNTSQSAPPYSDGLYAFATERINLLGGEFSSVRLAGQFQAGRFPLPLTSAEDFTELYISPDVFIAGNTILSGNFRIPQIDPGTFQDVILSSGNYRFEDDLTLNDGADFQSLSSTFLSMSNVILNSGSTLRIGDEANINDLTAKEDAALVMHSIWSATVANGFIGFPIKLQANITTKTSLFNINSELLVDHRRSWMPALGTTQQVAQLTADNLWVEDRDNTHAMTQQDLDTLSSGKSDHYLTRFDFLLSTSSTQQQITAMATGIPLAEKENNPLPPELTLLLDDYRRSIVQGTEMLGKFGELLLYLDNPETHDSTMKATKRHFNTAAAPMAVSLVQAGQRAQLNQVLRHVDSFRMAGGMASARPTPLGAAGPTESRSGWSGWMKGYGSNGTKDPDADFAGYDSTLVGAVIGIEKAFGNSLLGVASGSARSDINTDEPGSSDIDTWFGSLYGSYGAETWFIDSSLSYSHNQIDSRRGTLIPAQAEYDAYNVMGYIGGGRQYQLTDRLILTPELGGQLSYYHQESFTETGVIPNTYAAYDNWSFQSSLGANAAMLFPAGDALVFQPELRLHWQHNFNADPDRISYITEGTGTGASAAIQSPEEDTLVLGAGLTTLIRERLELDLRIDQQLSKGWKSTTYGGSLKFHF